MLRLRIPSDAPPVDIRLWTGEPIVSASNPIGHILFRSPRALAAVMCNPSLGFAQGYAEGEIEIDGDLVRVLRAILKSDVANKGPALLSRVRRWLSPNSIVRSKRNVMAHYDLGNDFFQLWLDETMSYSCAVFPSGGTPLERAQKIKCDLICRKLDLQPNDRFLDIGCGWGYLAIHAAEKYGAQSFGITESPEQQRFAAAWVARRGLGDRCRIELADYRTLHGAFHKIASVGMIEHVGRRYLGPFFQKISQLLQSGGRCLIQNVGQLLPLPTSDLGDRIFPGSYPPTGSEILYHAAVAGLQWKHADNLAEHYALTARCWRKNFEHAWEDVERLKGSVFTRWWDLYLALGEASFLVGHLQLFQTLFTKGRFTLPLSRDFAVIWDSALHQGTAPPSRLTA